MTTKPTNSKASLRRISLIILALEVWVLMVALYVFVIKKEPFTWARGGQLALSFLVPIALYFAYRWRARLRSKSSSDQQ